MRTATTSIPLTPGTGRGKLTRLTAGLREGQWRPRRLPLHILSLQRQLHGRQNDENEKQDGDESKQLGVG